MPGPPARRPRRRAAALVGAGVVVLLVVLAVAAAAGALPVPGATNARASLGPPHFVDVTAASGIAHTYAPLEDIGVGGGVAVLDCNGDGKPDLFLAGGTNAAGLYRNDTTPGGPLRFTPVGDAATDQTNVVGAYPIDIDGDGNTDLALLRVGGLELLRGLGDCRFVPADDEWSVDAGNHWTTAFSATWEPGARLPTLAVGNYLRLDAMGPATYACDDNQLLRPRADGTGYGPPLALTPGYCSLSMLFSDWDRSGRRDLRVSNDRHYYDFVNGGEQLWRMDPGAAPRLYGDADGWVQMQIWGMGIASYDVNGDGYPEVYLTTQGPNRLQTLLSGPAQPAFRDIGRKLGVEAGFPYAGDTTLPSTAWQPEFQDVNNDGFVDLFVAKGNVGEVPDFAVQDPSDLLLGQTDGTFVERAQDAGLQEFAPGRGAAFADFNMDGLLDLVEVKLGQPAKVWENMGAASAGQPTPMGHWIAIRATEPAPNVDAIGAWVEVRTGGTTQRRELTIGGGQASGELGWTHVGLGTATTADVRVIWPDGKAGPWLPAAADSFTIVRRDASAVERWSPAAR